MITKSQCLFLCLLVLCAITGCNRSTNNPAPTNSLAQPSPITRRVTSIDVVKASTQPVEITAGNSAEAIVRLEIQSGYHVNANPPTYSYLKATEFDIPSGNGISLASVVYPDAVTKKFSFAEQPLAVYEGNVLLKPLLRADRTAQKGERHLSGKLRIQACDDEVCYPPGSLDVEIPLRIK